MEVAKILVVDDEPSILKLLKEALTQWGYQVGCVGTGTEALEAIRTELYDAAITDIRMPEMSGLDLLREIKRHDESIEVIVMTGYPTIASAVEALKEGAYDYLSKPLILDELRHLMARVTERRFLKGEVQSLRTRLGEELTVNELVGNSGPMQRVKEIISKVATTDSPVLIEGESGTGKELVAAAIHRLSGRARSSRSTAVRFRKTCSSPSSSATFAGPSRARSPTRSACSAARTRARSSSTRSRNSRPVCRSSCCACCRRCRCARSARRRLTRSTSGSSRRPTATSTARLPTAGSARTSTIG
jgi:CheY-like chemotaxis protein